MERDTLLQVLHLDYFFARYLSSMTNLKFLISSGLSFDILAVMSFNSFEPTNSGFTSNDKLSTFCMVLRIPVHFPKAIFQEPHPVFRHSRGRQETELNLREIFHEGHPFLTVTRGADSRRVGTFG